VRIRALPIAFLACALVSSPLAAQQPPAKAAQSMPANDLHRLRVMLKEALETVQRHYYDPAFHGLDLAARFKDFDERLKSAPSMNVGLTLIAAFLDGLKDSHTSFQPPARNYTLEYGYRLIVIGDDIYVERVKEGSDAGAKVKPGDRLLSLNNSGVSRESFHRMQYLLNTLQPQPTTRLQLRDPAGAERTVVVETKVTPGRAVRDLFAGGGADLQDLEREAEAEGMLMRQRYAEIGDATIWKMPWFFNENAEIDRIFSDVKKHHALVLDLRGNPGGLVDTLKRMIGNVFTEDIAIGQRVTRKGRSTLTAKSRGNAAFTGRLIVLIDAASGSSAEIFARIVQLEKRGVVIGDRSAGAVMESKLYPFAQGNPMIVYGFSVTDADLIMKDGKSLEGSGVTPDEVIRPTGADLAAGRDPALARAAELAGVPIDAVAAGKLFPYQWK
jgi:carboxyl-terminal processing protease